jgi:hypothetical protein
MRKFYILGLTLSATFILGALATTSAFALESIWLVNGERLAAAVKMDSASVNSMRLEDMGTGVAIECKTTDKETIGPGPEGKTVEYLFTECTTVAGTCESPKVTVVKLPWKTAIVLVGSKYFERIESGGTGSPGLEIECTIPLIGKVKDTCTRSTFNFTLTPSGSDDDGAFNAEEPFNCTIGGAEKGLFSGTELLFTESGLSLAVSEG